MLPAPLEAHRTKWKLYLETKLETPAKKGSNGRKSEPDHTPAGFFQTLFKRVAYTYRVSSRRPGQGGILTVWSWQDRETEPIDENETLKRDHSTHCILRVFRLASGPGAVGG